MRRQEADGMWEMTKNDTVIREYQGLCDREELVRRIIRHYIREGYKKQETSESDNDNRKRKGCGQCNE